MNDRIRELADRLWRVHPKDIDAMGLKTRTEFYEHELKKFAELIVKEAGALLMSPEFIGRSDLDWSMVLNEHFGVESPAG